MWHNKSCGHILAIRPPFFLLANIVIVDSIYRITSRRMPCAKKPLASAGFCWGCLLSKFATTRWELARDFALTNWKSRLVNNDYCSVYSKLSMLNEELFSNLQVFINLAIYFLLVNFFAVTLSKKSSPSTKKCLYQ